MQSPCLCFQPHADHDLATPRLSAHAATVRPCWEASYGKSARAAPTLVDQPAVLVAEGIVPGVRSSCDQVSQEFLGFTSLGCAVGSLLREQGPGGCTALGLANVRHTNHNTLDVSLAVTRGGFRCEKFCICVMS